MPSGAEPPITGKRIYLRKVQPTDVDGPYFSWMQDPEVTRYLESRFSDNSKPAMKRFVQGALGDPDILFLAIVLKEGGRHIGNIKLGPINRHHKSADIGILIGDKGCWGKGYATEAISLLSAHAFKKLGLHKLTAGCYSGNTGSEKAFLAAGFALEGKRKEQYLFEGRYVDGLLFGLVNPEG
ncbi:MAG: GNAT family protein [Candidatus Micrarchaeota archaeon]